MIILVCTILKAISYFRRYLPQCHDPYLHLAFVPLPSMENENISQRKKNNMECCLVPRRELARF